ncbi:MAG: hypothetical protein ACM3XO_28815 [Bacteroidota bacterium]
MRFSGDFKDIFFRYILGLAVLVLVFAAGMYAYLGTFSRYGGDDYCEAALIRTSSPIAAVFERYFGADWPRATMRYSNLLFVGFSESLGRYNMQITIPLMILLWFAGCIWLTHEIRKISRVQWDFLVDLFLGLTFGFFCLRQAPDLFQTVYWRSAMMTHFAPLVFSLFLFSFVIRQARRIAEGKSPAWFVYLFLIAVTFVIAGFSEPPTTTMLTVFPLLMLAILLWERSPAKGKYLALLGSVFVGAFLGLLAMLLSPATAGAAQEKTLNVVHLLATSFLFSYQFIFDSFKTQPLPLFLALLIPLILVWAHGQIQPSELSSRRRRTILIVMAAAPFLAWVLIAAGFSPSVYGQSYPVERMRFLARAILIATFMLEGVLLGLFLGQVKFSVNPAPVRSLAAILFVVVAIGYPLRTSAGLVQKDLPEFRTRAGQWDARDAYIREMKTNGARELTVPFLSGEIIQDLGDRREYRLNRCASTLYGVDSILALPMKKQ